MQCPGHSERKTTWTSLRRAYGVEGPPISACFHPYLLETNKETNKTSNEQIYVTSQILSALTVLYGRLYLLVLLRLLRIQRAGTVGNHDPMLFQNKTSDDMLLGFVKVDKQHSHIKDWVSISLRRFCLLFFSVIWHWK